MGIAFHFLRKVMSDELFEIRRLKPLQWELQRNPKILSYKYNNEYYKIIRFDKYIFYLNY